MQQSSSDKQRLSEIRAEAAKQRKKFGAGSGRPKSPDRCPCGAMTRERAEKRGHRC